MTTSVNEWSDTDRWSHYVDDAFYADLLQLLARFDEDWPIPPVTTWLEASHVLSVEARLLDQRRFDDWLALFTSECLYWVPAARSRADPRASVSHAFDDRRRLGDRVYWLNTGLAFSQIPPSRTVHTVSNVELLDLDVSTRLVRSTFATHECRTAEPRVFAGWNAHVLAREGNGWRIRAKQVNLFDADAGHENLTLVL